MTKDEIIEMAKPRAWHGKVEGWTFNSYEELEAFAKLLADKEREACALICDEFPDVGLIGKKITSEYHAYLIRARGQV